MRLIVLSKDKIEFLENWKMEKYDHLQEIIQHVEAERKLQNHAHSIDAHTYDIFYTGLTLLPVDVAKKVLSECTFFTSYLHNYKPGHFFDKSEKTETEKEAEANELACKWVSESPYMVPRDNFEHCSCPQWRIDFCKALATSA
jgi:tmRNA-binding protein